MTVDRADLIRTLSDLVRINSINPTLVPGAPGEAEIAGYVASWLEKAGLEVDRCEVTSRESRKPFFEVVTAWARKKPEKGR